MLHLKQVIPESTPSLNTIDAPPITGSIVEITKSRFLALVLLTLGAIACGRSPVDDQDRNLKQCQGISPTTAKILRSFEKAETFRGNCLLNAELEELQCNINFPEQFGRCQEAKDQAELVCYNITATIANEHTLRDCGARIFNQRENPSEGSFVNEEDTDGDGILNFHEFNMGLNPCAPQTYGNCEPSDSDLDFDGDGNPNAADGAPLCNEPLDKLDPGENRFGCV